MKQHIPYQLFAALAFVALFVPVSSMAQGVDFMYLADQYGQNVQNILHTEIMNDAGRRTMELARGKSSQGTAPKPAWPAHISTSSVNSHVFTVEEVAAMHGNDRNRTRQMLDGRTITISGTVFIPDNQRYGPISFRLKSASGDGYDVWVSYRGANRPAWLKSGMHVQVQGKAEAKRSSYLTLTSPKVLSSPSSQGNAPKTVSTTTGTPSTTTSNYSALRFTRSVSVTNQVNEQLAKRLAPMLKTGNSEQDLLNMLNSGELQKQFERVMVSYGFSAQDVGDVLAAATVLNWQVANRHEADPPRAGIQVIRENIRNALASKSAFTNIRDPQKQALADFFSTSSLIIASRYQFGRENGDNGTMSQAAKDANDLVKALLGVDLRSYRLEATGFVRK